MSYIFKKIDELIINEINEKHPEIHLSEKTKLYTGILQEYLKSKYFRNKYKNFKSIEIENNNELYYRIGYSQFENTNYIYDYFGKISPYLSQIDKYENYSNKKIVDIELTNEMKEIIQSIRSKDNTIDKIFEDNEIKIKLIEKNKNDLSFEVIDNLDVDYIKNIVKEEYLNTKEDCLNYLSYNCGIKYIDLKEKGKYFIVKNDESIAGIALLVDNPFVYLTDNEKNSIKNRDQYKYLSYVNVSREFLGMNLGVKLIEEIYKHCALNSYIYETSDYTTDGNKYLNEKVKLLNIKYENELIVIEQKDRKKKEALIAKESLKGKDFEDIKSILEKSNKNLSLKIKPS